MIIDLSRDSDYRTQLNNKLVPLSSCNTTAMCMALEASGVPLPERPGVQPEDDLTAVTETPEAYAEMARGYPWAFAGSKPIYPPRQVHGMLSWATNRWLGRPVTRFREDVPIEELLADLAQGRACVVSGRFTASGHMVALVGVETDQVFAGWTTPDNVELASIRALIIDDPYGDYHTGYKDHRGNGCSFSLAEFSSLTREYDRYTKWAHQIIGG